jgi:hypothetical protein
MNTGDSAMREQEKRRCKRLPLKIPVRVYGRTPNNRPFRDTTVTKTVDAHGATISLESQVKPGQTVLLVNGYTDEERHCRIVYVDSRNRPKKRRVGIEFIDPRGDFWHVFPELVQTNSPRGGAVQS